MLGNSDCIAPEKATRRSQDPDAVEVYKFKSSILLVVACFLHKKRHTLHRIRMHSISRGFLSTRKIHTLVTRFGFYLLLFDENLELLHTKKRDTCDKIRICSNSRYFDFEIDPDRVTGVSLLCWKIRILLHPKKRHAGDRIRMESNFRNSKILFCLLVVCLLACLNDVFEHFQ